MLSFDSLVKKIKLFERGRIEGGETRIENYKKNLWEIRSFASMGKHWCTSCVVLVCLCLKSFWKDLKPAGKRKHPQLYLLDM